ncbi:DUF2141 domain-containing protein [Cellvibrio sp. UBA7671]|uniref:DUF2141 domain-containing protein n=1 Tax=Cellvibrio sp. UBA7671 TaxID=1946312 RepID=UPI002F35DBBE
MRINTGVFAVVSAIIALPTFAHELTLNVINIKSVKGNLLVAVYDKEEHYTANSNWVAAKQVKVSGTTMLLDFADLPAGNYAIKLFQDENENNQIDIGANGIPTELYGFSNNGGSYGPPSFDEAKVVVDKATEIEIQLR